MTTPLTGQAAGLPQVASARKPRRHASDRLFGFQVSPDGWDITQDPVQVIACAGAFESVWDRAVLHEDYRPDNVLLRRAGTRSFGLS
jgi:hypothetical protein